MHATVPLKMDDIAGSRTQRNFAQTQIELGLSDYDRDNEDEDQILISPSDANRKDDEFKSTMNGPFVDVLHMWTLKRVKNRIFGSIRIVTMQNKINLLLPFGPAAVILAHFLKAEHGWIFFFSLLGITPLAERLGFVTEQLAFFTGPTVGGLLNATFGNATEMIISLYALDNGMIRIVQQSLLGSILSNMLLVLGCAFFMGGVIHHQKEQVFNKAAAVVNSGLLLMAVMGLLFPAVLYFTHTELHVGKSELSLSRFSSCVMLVAYVFYLVFQLKSHRNLYDPVDQTQGENGGVTDEEEVAVITHWEAIAWLAILTAWISFLSGYLVNAIEIPFCVVVGWIMGKSMDLNFQLFETATLFITVIVVAFMLQEGTSNYFKGLMLILCYMIVAASFFVHVDPKHTGHDND